MKVKQKEMVFALYVEQNQSKQCVLNDKRCNI
jgi:hypothetical protein